MGLGSIVGSILGTDDGSGQAAAAAEANRISKEQYDQMRSDLSGYRDLGQTGLSQITNNLADLTGTFSMDKFQKDPGYDFRMQEGAKALERSASARGGLMGGAAGKAMARYGQDYASNEYNNAYNRFNQDRDQRYGKLMDLVGTGQNAANQTGAAGQNYANSYGQNVMGAANAQAAANNMNAGIAGSLLGQAVGGFAGMGGGGGGATTLAAGTSALPQAVGAGSFRFSDRRLKTNITKFKTSIYKEVPTYAFEYIDKSKGIGTQVGAMAQDLLALDAKHPAVGTQDGFYTVDYSKLEAI